MRTDASGHRIGGLLVLALLAVAVRVAAVFAVGSYKLDRVTYEHGEIARNLVEGRGFTVRWLGAEGPTSQQAPVYPALLAGCYKFFGVESTAAKLAMQLFQALLGSLLAVCVVLLARELLPDGPLVGWLAGAGAAVYPTLVYATTQIQVASLATLLVVVVLWSAARSARLNSVATAAACGAASGVLILTDPILGLVVFAALLMLGGRLLAPPRSRTHPMFAVNTAALFGVALMACIATVTPWVMRNYVVHGELVPVKSTFGYAFWQGNHARSFGTDKIPLAEAAGGPARTLDELERSLWHTRLHQTLYIDDAVLSRDRVTELGRLPEPQRSRQLLAESLAYIGQHPWHYARLCLQRLRYFLLFDETNPKSRVWVYRVSHLALLVVSLAGLWVSRQRAGRLWPTYLVFGLVTAFHTLTIVSARFHIPVEPIQIIWGSCAIAWALGVIQRVGLRACASSHRNSTSSSLSSNDPILCP